MAESGRYRPKSYSEMEQQAGRIHGTIVPMQRRIVNNYIEAERDRIMRNGRGYMDDSDVARARLFAVRSSEYQRLQRRLNRVDSFLNRNRPDFEEEPLDIFNPNADTPERRRNLDRLNRRTRTRK